MVCKWWRSCLFTTRLLNLDLSTRTYGLVSSAQLTLLLKRVKTVKALNLSGQTRLGEDVVFIIKTVLSGWRRSSLDLSECTQVSDAWTQALLPVKRQCSVSEPELKQESELAARLNVVLPGHSDEVTPAELARITVGGAGDVVGVPWGRLAMTGVLVPEECADGVMMMMAGLAAAVKHGVVKAADTALRVEGNIAWFGDWRIGETRPSVSTGRGEYFGGYWLRGDTLLSTASFMENGIAAHALVTSYDVDTGSAGEFQMDGMNLTTKLQQIMAEHMQREDARYALAKQMDLMDKEEQEAEESRVQARWK